MSGPFVDAKEGVEWWMQRAKDNEADAVRLQKEKCDALDAKRASEAEVERLRAALDEAERTIQSLRELAPQPAPRDSEGKWQ